MEIQAELTPQPLSEQDLDAAVGGAELAAPTIESEAGTLSTPKVKTYLCPSTSP